MAILATGPVLMALMAMPMPMNANPLTTAMLVTGRWSMIVKIGDAKVAIV